MSLYGKFSPIAKYGVPDYDQESQLWEDWLEEQEHYCLNGYTAGGDTISGRLYFKLNFSNILITDKDGNKRPQHPFYADAQREFYDLLEECLNPESSYAGKNIVVGKGRDKGFTYDIAALSVYQTQLIDFSTILALFPGGQSPARANFDKAFDLTYNAMPSDMTHAPGIADNKTLRHYGWIEKDEVTKKSKTCGIQSSITRLDAVSPDVGKSGRYKLVILEEFGEIENPLALITTSEANMREGAKKFGIIIAGGTSNAMNKGYKDFRKLWYEPDAYNFVKFFIPANKMYWGYINPETGISDMDGAKEHRMQIRKKLKGPDLAIEMQNYPFTEEEMFIAIGQSPFDSKLASLQIANIMSHNDLKNAIQIGNLYEKADGTVEFRIEQGGRWQLLKQPAEDLSVKDVGGVDTYRFADVEDKESAGAIVIYRPFQGASKPGSMPICIYRHRWDKKEHWFRDVLLTAKYYKIKMLIEKSDEDIFTYFRQHNATQYLKERPRVIDSKSISDYQYGVYASMQAKNMATEMAIEDFNQNYEQNLFVDLLDELINFGSQNTDLAMAYIWAVMHANDVIRILPQYQQKRKEKPFMPYCITGPDGRLVVINSPIMAQQHGTTR